MPNCIRPPHFPPGCGCPVGNYASGPGSVKALRPVTVADAEAVLADYQSRFPDRAFRVSLMPQFSK